MYDYPRRSIRGRALRIARQRGWIGEGGAGMAVPIVLLVVAAFAVIWMAFAITGFVFSLIPLALVGLLTGWVASRLTGTRLGPGWTILAGIAGSWLGGAIFSGLLGVRVGGLFNPMHLVASVLGAAILIAFARVLARPALTGPSRPRLGRM
jgi:uncharacterized membrane protein YeaQ/YmgE (transglycosylase-associated protein family)